MRSTVRLMTLAGVLLLATACGTMKMVARHVPPGPESKVQEILAIDEVSDEAAQRVETHIGELPDRMQVVDGVLLVDSAVYQYLGIIATEPARSQVGRSLGTREQRDASIVAVMQRATLALGGDVLVVLVKADGTVGGLGPPRGTGFAVRRLKSGR